MDLQRTVNELIAAGLSQGQIAEAIEVEQATVSRYASGDIKSCTFAIGERLGRLHQRHVPRRRRKAA